MSKTDPTMTNKDGSSLVAGESPRIRHGSESAPHRRAPSQHAPCGRLRNGRSWSRISANATSWRTCLPHPGEGTAQAGGPFWKLAQALFEIPTRDLEDWKLVNALLGERQTLRAEGKQAAFRDIQGQLDLRSDR